MRERIFIVEDEVIVAIEIKRTIEKLGFVFAGMASNDTDALRAVPKVMPDLILMDMDGKDRLEGVEFAKKLMEYTLHPIVFLSADDDKEFLQRILELTPYGFLFKPFSPKDILISMQLAYKNFLNQHYTNLQIRLSQFQNYFQH